MQRDWSNAKIMVPALTLTNANGTVDAGATRAYAEMAHGAWYHRFILSGSIGLGFQLTTSQREQTLETWLDCVPPARLMACAWNDDDIRIAERVGVTPMAVLQGFTSDEAALDWLQALPHGAFVYSHPAYTGVTFDAVLTRAGGSLVQLGGAKVSKVGLHDIGRMRRVLGEKFELYDGRSRHILKSIEAGATGVVVVPLNTLPSGVPPREDITRLQGWIDKAQESVDLESTVSKQAAHLVAVLQTNLRRHLGAS